MSLMPEIPRVPYYIVKDGRGFWNPTKRMKVLGFSSVPCGPDGPEAKAIATKWNDRWQASRAKPIAEKPPKRGYIYFLKIGQRIKIGFSQKPFTRAGDMRTGFTDKVSMLVAVPGVSADEKRLHKRFIVHKVNGEWFAASDAIKRFAMRAAMFEAIKFDGTDAEIAA